MANHENRMETLIAYFIYGVNEMSGCLLHRNTAQIMLRPHIY